jgi:hypothetical protein
VGAGDFELDDITARVDQADPDLVADMRVADGTYRRWTPEGGIDLWLQAASDGRTIGLIRHVRGGARLRASLVRRVTVLANPLGGGFVAQPLPADEDAPVPDAITFVSPDFRAHDELDLPAIVDLQLAGEVGRPAIAPAGREPVVPETELEGIVLRTGERTDPITGEAFAWLLVAARGGAIDLVVDSALPLAGTQPGVTIHTRCVLTGLIHPVDRSRSRRAVDVAAVADASPPRRRVRRPGAARNRHPPPAG